MTATLSRAHGPRKPKRVFLGALLATSVVALAGCGSSSSSSSSAQASASGSTSSSSGSSTSGKQVHMAFLAFAVANSYQMPMINAARAVAKKEGATFTVLDANNSPATQNSQLQTAVSSGQYNVLLMQPVFGAGVVTGVQSALSAGIKVVGVDQIIGSNLTTDAAQVKGMSGNVVFVPGTIGTKLGKLTVAACAAQHANPCPVGFMYDVKASPLDSAIRSSFDKAIAGSPVKVAAEGESEYQISGGLQAAQTMLQAQPGLKVIVASDQGIEGAIQALSSHSSVSLVGYGGSAAALKGVKNGTWYADVAQVPATEGRLAATDAIAAVRTGKVSPAEDPVSQLPDQGVITKSNVSQFQAQWPG
jgi:ribose transport system substrate-binding protein